MLRFCILRDPTTAFDHRAVARRRRPRVSTLRWALYLLARHPDVQKRAHRKLDVVLCARVPPRPSDRTSLQFTEALLCELQRLESVIPVAHLRAEE